MKCEKKLCHMNVKLTDSDAEVYITVNA